MDHLKWLHKVFSIIFLVLLLVLDLGFFYKVFDFLFSQSQMIVLSSLVLVFQSQLLDENCIWVSVVWEKKSS